jgi:hypothetical protein
MKKKVLLFLLQALFATAYAQSETQGWFPFKPTTDYTSSVINMKGWLDAPAGKHGFVQMKNDDLEFKDGTKVKFWGVNIASNRPFVESGEATRWAEFIATYGINAVRFHKFTWDATDGIHSTQLTEAKWKNFDFFCSQLKQRGIYYSWSHIYGHRILKADSSRLLAYSEVANTRFPWSHVNGSTAAIVNFAEDLQDLNIELTVNMLNHRNPVTGLRYADDPALAHVELQNEDNIFWSAIEATLKQTPTYRALLCKKFSQWLKNKYQSQDALEAAWGKDVVPKDETLEGANIYPQPNHGLFTAASEKAWNAKAKLPQHIVDKAMFLYQEQAKFYTRFEKAIRNTGYKGVIVGSCWQAGSGLAHLLNLYADYRAGVIDRHNYSGGGTGHTLVRGKVNNRAMVSMPGSGLLSTGFQQVSNRPFFISEWMSLIPNEWTAESAPIIAAYGLGLQGWDASYSFAMDYSHFTPTIQSGHGVYNVTSPTQLALYPALSSMIYNNDVAKAPVIASRKVSIDSLSKGSLPFFEKVEQEADVKKLQSLLPLEALAIGRVVLDFDDKNSLDHPVVNKLPASTGKIIKSTTGQLIWDYNNKGYFTINTRGTQGVVGFLPDHPITLNDFTLHCSNNFAVITATSLTKGKQLSNSNRILITTIARARNTGMKYNENETELLNVGTAPLLLEPVRLEATINRRKNWKVYVLDHTGNRTALQVPVKNRKIILDGSTYKAIYYELVSQ